MKFDICRVSDYMSRRRPCSRAVADAERSNEYYTTYTIEINSLEELIALKDEVGAGLIVTDNGEEELHQIIEIYDGYRE